MPLTDNTNAPTYQDLSKRRTSPERDKRNRALYMGGELFEQSAQDFLPQKQFEPMARYSMRLRAAKNQYQNHIGHIVNSAETQLFAHSFNIRSKRGTEEDLPPFYASFKENCDRQGTDLQNFVRSQFVSANVNSGSHVLVHLPDPGVPREQLTISEFEAIGGGAAYLEALPCDALMDYEHASDGALLWVLVHEKREPRASISERRGERIVETWRFLDREFLVTYRIEYKRNQPPMPDTIVPEVERRAHGFRGVPMASLIMPDGLHLLERGGSPAIAHFQLISGLAYILDLVCHPTPKFQLQNPAQSPEIAKGYGIALQADREAPEDFSYVQPDASSFQTHQTAINAVRDEIYRTTGSFPLASNNTAGLKRQSGDARALEVAMSEVSLTRYGALVREFVETIYSIIASGRGEQIDFEISGLDRFAVMLHGTSLPEMELAMDRKLPSETFNVELKASYAERFINALPQHVRSRVRAELEASEANDNGEATSKPKEAQDPRNEPKQFSKARDLPS